MEYLFTLLAVWPNGTNELIQRVASSEAVCVKLLMWYVTTLRADGVDSIAWSCVQQIGV